MRDHNYVTGLWRVVEDEPTEMVVQHRYKGIQRTIKKGTRTARYAQAMEDAYEMYTLTALTILSVMLTALVVGVLMYDLGVYGL